MKTKIVTINNNKMGVIYPDSPNYVMIIAMLFCRGARFSITNGPEKIESSDIVKRATLEDFKDFRVCPLKYNRKDYDFT